MSDDGDEGLPVVVSVVRPRPANGHVLELETVDVTGDVLARPLRIHGADHLQPTKDVFGRRMVAHRPGPAHEVGEPALLYLYGKPNPLELALSRGDFIEGVEFIDECNGVIKVGLARAEQAHHLVQRDRPRLFRHRRRGRR